MNAFTDLFIRRPVLATVVSLLILLIGGMAARRLQVQIGRASCRERVWR